MVTIPKASNSRPRQRNVPGSLTSADVPLVSPASDPGVNVPLEPTQSVQSARNNDVLGPALHNVSQLLDSEVDASLRIIQRNEGLARDSDDTTFNKLMSEELRNLQATSDLSDDAVIQSSIVKMQEENARILSEHRGGQASKAMLQNRLKQRLNNFSDTLAVLNIKAADDRLNKTVEGRLSAITQDVLTDPDVLVSEDPLEAFRSHSAQLDKEIAFLNLRPSQVNVVRRAGQAEIVMTMITPLIQNGQFERAKEILRSEEISEVVPSELQRDAATRIITAERKLLEGQLAGEAQINMARSLLGPSASDEQVRAAAQQMAGIKSQNNLEFFEVGGSVLVVNKGTGALVDRLQGQTPEEEAERTKLNETAKLLARSETLSQILQDAGAEPLPEVDFLDPAGSRPTEGGDGSEEQGGSGDLVGSSRAITHPFGGEEAASEDIQAASRLFLASRRLLMIGETAIANSLMGQARFILENSPEIKRQQELEKPISPELAAELGFPVGTTLRGVLGVIPRSPEEKAGDLARAKPISPEIASEEGLPLGTTAGEVEGITPKSPEQLAQERARGGARGRSQVDAEEQLTFIDEARVQLTDLLEELEDDPTLVGGVGAFRATGRSALTFLDDVGLGNLVSSAKDLAFEDSELGMDEVMDLFDDSTLSSLDILANSTGLILARLRTPAGRIPVELIKRSIEDVGLKGLRGSKVVEDRLRFVMGLLDQRSNSIRKRFPDLVVPEAEDPVGQSVPPGTPRFRIEGGSLVPSDGVPGGDTSERPF